MGKNFLLIILTITSPVFPSRARSLFRPLLPSACYAGYFNNAGSNNRNQRCWVITIRICYRSFKKTEKKNTQICVDSGQGLYLINQSINQSIGSLSKDLFERRTSNRKWTFCKIRQWFHLNFWASRLYDSKDTKHYEFGSVKVY